MKGAGVCNAIPQAEKSQESSSNDEGWKTKEKLSVKNDNSHNDVWIGPQIHGVR